MLRKRYFYLTKTKSLRRRVNRVNESEIVEAQQGMGDVDGIIRTTVEPHLNFNGQSRSSRRRTDITHFLE